SAAGALLTKKAAGELMDSKMGKGLKSLFGRKDTPFNEKVKGSNFKEAIKTGAEKVKGSKFSETIKSGVEKVKGSKFGEAVQSGVEKIKGSKFGEAVQSGKEKLKDFAFGKTAKETIQTPNIPTPKMPNTKGVEGFFQGISNIFKNLFEHI